MLLTTAIIELTAYVMRNRAGKPACRPGIQYRDLARICSRCHLAEVCVIYANLNQGGAYSCKYLHRSVHLTSSSERNTEHGVVHSIHSKAHICAAWPELVASAARPDSNAATRSSKTDTVGLDSREYTFPNVCKLNKLEACSAESKT